MRGMRLFAAGQSCTSFRLFSANPPILLVGVNRTLKRNKVFDAGRVQGRVVAALDGIEVLSSYSRCCDACLERRVTVRKNGIKTEQVQYYHAPSGVRSSSAHSRHSSLSNGSSRMKERRPPLCGCSAKFPNSMAALFRHPSARCLVRSNCRARFGSADRLGCGDQS